MKVTDIYYFSGTHWDREWYDTFQGFRHRLCNMVDELIDHLEEEEEYKTFYFDGQTVVLEDCKEIAPENEEKLIKLIKEGRIKIGPWYCMPDEFLVSGESLIRNLLVGHRLSKKWGANPWRVGDVCDVFGHIAQMPQIFNGFGIKSSILGRGTTESDPMFFTWTAPDGSKCINFKVESDEGYGSFNGHMKKKVEILGEDREAKKAAIKEYVDKEIERSNTQYLILMDGMDHRTVQTYTADVLRMLKELYPDITIHHGNIEEGFEKLYSMATELPEFKGELNKTAQFYHGYLRLITDTLSSYYPLKKANDECQYMLEKIMEPMHIYANMKGVSFRHSYIDMAYEYLLKNHPHDSICGCSVEQVHKDMEYRFDQIKNISETITMKFLHDNTPSLGEPKSYALKLYNFLPYERNEVVTAELLITDRFPTRYREPVGYEEIASFKLLDSKGNEIPYKIKERITEYKKHESTVRAFRGCSYKITFEASLPPSGYAEYKVVPCPTPIRYFDRLASGENWVENEFVKIEITTNGELDLYDKKTNKAYKNLLGIVSDGEIGDGWYHVNPVNDTSSYSKGESWQLEKTEDAPSKCTFRITKEMMVPSHMENLVTGKVRSSEYKKLKVIMELSLLKGERAVRVNMNVENTAKDHRLRLILPTGINSDTYFAGQAFYCNERQTGMDYTTSTWGEIGRCEKQMNGIVGKREQDGKGVAFVSPYGLHECAAPKGDIIYVTLLRAFGNVVHSMPQERGQLIGKHSYEFSIVPLDKDVSYSDLVKIQDNMGTKILTSCYEASEEYKPETKSFMELSGEDINYSIAKTAEEGNGIILRVYNTSDKKKKGKVSFAKDIKAAYEANLNEEILEELKAKENALTFELAPWKIGTYRIEF